MFRSTNLGVTEILARSLMAEHGLTDWTFKWDRSVNRLGNCNHTDRTISLGVPYVEANGYMDVKDTILHEIAHALAGFKAGHGWVWKAVCKEIGAEPSRLGHHTVRLAPYKYVVVCIGCGTVLGHRHRRRKNAYHMPNGFMCGRVEYQERREA